MTYLNNKYTKIYHQIISRAQQRILSEYVETHHIIPKSLGGSDDKSNLTNLTAREHFICHWLLTKMTTGKDKADMFYALNGMKRKNKHQERYETKITSRVYARIRPLIAEQHSKRMTGIKRGPQSADQRAITSAANKGKNKGKTPWNKGKSGLQIAWNKGIARTEEEKAAIRAGKQNISPEVAAKISAAKTGVAWSESRKLASNATCPHCGKEGNRVPMGRWHFDNCKFKK